MKPNILALRCVHASHRQDEFWKERINARAARNDSLSLSGLAEEFCLATPRRQAGRKLAETLCYLRPFFLLTPLTWPVPTLSNPTPDRGRFPQSLR